MSDENVIEERDGYRVRLEYDLSPEEPYDDGAWPVLQIELRHGRAKHLNPRGGRPHELDYAVENAVSHWQTSPSDRDWKLFEKWLRAYLGVTRIETYSSDDYWYVAYDSAAWRKAVNPGDENWKPAETEDPLHDVRAWVNGDVHGYVIEKRVTWKPVSCTAGDDVTMDTWEPVSDGSCWGFYGYDWAEQAAQEEFEALLESENAGKSAP